MISLNTNIIFPDSVPFFKIFNFWIFSSALCYRLFWRKTTCSPYLQSTSFLVFDFLRCFFFFFFFLTFLFGFCFGPHGNKNSIDISAESTHQIHSQKVVHTSWGVGWELFKQLRNFKFRIFVFFFSSERTHPIRSKNHAYSCGGSLAKLLKQLQSFKFLHWSLFCLFFLTI